MKYIGIDPSLRHTGLCLLEYDGKKFKYYTSEVETSEDILTSAKKLRAEVRLWLRGTSEVDEVIFGMEKMPASTITSPLLFYVQMILMEEVEDRFLNKEPQMIHPLPVQLKAYLRDMWGVDLSKGKTGIVQRFKTLTGFAKRISQHRVEAYFLAHMARHVSIGEFQLKLSERELPLTPWRMMGGTDGTGCVSKDSREEVEGQHGTVPGLGECKED